MSEVQPVVFLKGRNVSLRPIEKTDLPNCVRWINDPEIRDLLKAFWPTTQEDEEEWFVSLGKSRPHQMVLAIVTNEGQHIGHMGLHKINWRSRLATTGAIIGEKDCWGKGYGTEAKILLLHFAFQSLNLRRIMSSAIAFNERSLAYSKKCGYQQEGVFKDHVFRRGQYWDMIQLAVFWENFKPIWEAYQKEEK